MLFPTLSKVEWVLNGQFSLFAPTSRKIGNTQEAWDDKANLNYAYSHFSLLLLELVWILLFVVKANMDEWLNDYKGVPLPIMLTIVFRNINKLWARVQYLFDTCFLGVRLRFTCNHTPLEYGCSFFKIRHWIRHVYLSQIELLVKLTNNFVERITNVFLYSCELFLGCWMRPFNNSLHP